jgi:4-hydroxy-3-methylbut-2-en-1-yl diphosphate reductase
MTKELFLAYPHGFCAGVKRAVSILEKCLEKYKSPIFVNHEIVHNQYLVDYFKEKGVQFDVPLEKIPQGSLYIFSAHGVSPDFREQCHERGLRVIDATCPLVLKVHREAEIYSKKGYKIIFIGQKQHQECKGTSGVAEMQIIEKLTDIKKITPENYEKQKVICLCQTTMSLDDTEEIILALKEKIPHLEIIKDICYASQNRQKAVKEIAPQCDFIIVLGSKNSSNSNSLVETARKHGSQAELFENLDNFPEDIFEYEKIGITAGASVPENLYKKATKIFQEKNPQMKINTITVAEEKLNFPLPLI